MLNYMLLKKNFSRLINDIFIPIACLLAVGFVGGPMGNASTFLCHSFWLQFCSHSYINSRDCVGVYKKMHVYVCIAT